LEGLLELNSCVDILHRLEIGAELGVSSKVVRFRNLAKLELLVQNERWVLDRRNLEDFIGVVPFAQKAHILTKEWESSFWAKRPKTCSLFFLPRMLCMLYTVVRPLSGFAAPVYNFGRS